MKIMKIWHRGLTILIGCLFCLSVSANTQSNTTNKADIKYISSEDRLSIQANNSDMRHVLGQIAYLTSIEILIDPSVTGKVTSAIKNQKSERIIRRITRNYSTLFSYTKKGNESLLTRVTVLPKGTQESNKLQRLVTLEGEAVHHGTTKPRESANFDSLRWNHRMRKMDDKKRAHLDKAIERWEKRSEKNKQRLDNIRARLNKDLSKSTASLRERDEKLKQQDPEAWERRQNKYEIIRQRVKEAKEAQ